MEECCYAERRYAECCYADCQNDAFMLSVGMLSVIGLSVAEPF